MGPADARVVRRDSARACGMRPTIAPLVGAARATVDFLIAAPTHPQRTRTHSNHPTRPRANARSALLRDVADEEDLLVRAFEFFDKVRLGWGRHDPWAYGNHKHCCREHLRFGQCCHRSGSKWETSAWDGASSVTGSTARGCAAVASGWRDERVRCPFLPGRQRGDQHRRAAHHHG
jgi:hypothetical protein